MSRYNFKKITVVPSSKDFIDVVLSKTQRKTPTVIHKTLPIVRIRAFYLRKIRFAQQSYHDKLTKIINQFPIVDDIHPFYADLINVLYDRDHYKLALGQVNIARALIDKLSKEYQKLMKYADSLYRCKLLKIAALGRMVKIIKKQSKSLDYLEQVRQHLSRFPSIDPNSRTIILCGFPNVGKSSFINKITRANVEVQPYAFTTKSLYVGHTDYRYLRWQVIDTPGILDHELEERNTIEMQSVTALAHLKSAIIYFMDLSETCGQSISAQISLLNNIRPLFHDKPIIIALNKTDLKTIHDIDETDEQTLRDLEKEGLKLMELSTIEDNGISEIKSTICDMLLAKRVEEKLKKHSADRAVDQLVVSKPGKIPENRLPIIPDCVTEKLNDLDEGMKSNRVLEKDIEDEQGRDYLLDLKKKFILPNKNEAYDAIPEIINGKNIIDFADINIVENLKQLQMKESERKILNFYDINTTHTPQDIDIQNLAKRIREKRITKIKESRLNDNAQKPRLPRSALKININKMQREMSNLGVIIDKNGGKVEKHFIKSRTKSIKRDKGKKVLYENIKMDKARSMSMIQPQHDLEGLRDEDMRQKSISIMHYSQRARNQDSRKGEGDRHVYTKRPKHLFSGKRKSGKTQRR
ncbi:Nucleolar GTP-binding protein 1 [Intoshia linei]|uniref:Nucleolar GTP-binding protein 1 n=1 Tax=Intoshia linei TaxID=1819745 RepID=A0A177BAG9_9BILA|nr:Nucleolar GTP-binding protein 1 [Intoshia linei]